MDDQVVFHEAVKVILSQALSKDALRLKRNPRCLTVDVFDLDRARSKTQFSGELVPSNCEDNNMHLALRRVCVGRNCRAIIEIAVRTEMPMETDDRLVQGRDAAKWLDIAADRRKIVFGMAR